MIQKYVPLISVKLPKCPKCKRRDALEIMSRAYYNGYVPGYIEARCRFCEYSQRVNVYPYKGYDYAVELLKSEWGKGVKK